MEKFEFRRNMLSSNTINIHLVKSMGLTGISDDTNDFVESTKISLVNPTTDAEYIRLVYFGNNFDLIPNFKGADQTYNNSLTNALFNNIEIKNRVDVITNSYFIFELYDLNDISNQRDRLKIANRENVNNNKDLKNRADTINKAASNARIVRKLSIFSKDRTRKSN